MTWAAGYDMDYFDYYSYSQTIAFTVVTPDTHVFVLDGTSIALIAVLAAAACLGVGLFYRRANTGQPKK